MKCCLSIAGSDSSGGAGIQADLKTFAAHNIFGMSAITALTAQNTLGVHGVKYVSPDFIEQQISAVFDDIRPDSVKIGMLANQAIVLAVAARLTFYNAGNVVLDPVMIATSGDPLLDRQAIGSIIHSLIPYSDIITPNISELISLCEAQSIDCDIPAGEINQHELKRLTTQLHASLPNKKNGGRVAILSKGGHLSGDIAADYLIDSSGQYWFESPRVDTANTHGTGCTLSSAISANLAIGYTLHQACAQAKDYLNQTLAKGLDLGSGNGPLNHYTFFPA